MKAELVGLDLCLLALLACGGGPTWNSKRLTRDPAGDLVSVTCEGGMRHCHLGAVRACPSGFTVVESSRQAKEHWPGSMLVRCAPRGKE